MAIIEKDGFEFLSDNNGLPESFIVKGNDLNEEIKYIRENRIKSIYLTYFKSKLITDLEFLNELNFIEKVNLNDLEIDYSGLYQLKDLKYAILSVKNKSQHLDYKKFEKLEYLSIDYYSQFPDLSKNIKLKELVIWKFRPKSKSFNELKLPESLQNFQISESNVTNFSGLELPNLEKIEGHFCKDLESLNGIKELSSKLKILILDQCKKLNGYEELAYCINLEKMILGSCGSIESLKWLKNLNKVNHFAFVGTQVNDGDIRPCVGIRYVAFKNSPNYNMKREEFDGNPSS